MCYEGYASAMNLKLPPEKDLIRTGIRLAKTICGWSNQSLRGSLKQMSVEQRDYKDPNNITRALDGLAHNYIVFELRQQFGQQIAIFGEEASGTPESFQRINKVVALVDAIDGTDLVARGFSNWCSALAFFHPKEKRILATVVGHSSGEVYYASSEGAYKRTLNGTIKRLRRNPEESLKLENASVCFYGQKPHNILTVMKDETSQAFQEKLVSFRRRMKEGKEGLSFRLYNFGGNPMMIKIPERTVDAVFELSGQKAHDVIPGAYIAAQAGAVFMDLKGNEVNPAHALLTPNKKLTYVLAGTKSLAEELRELLSVQGKRPDLPLPQITAQVATVGAGEKPVIQSLPFDSITKGKK